MHIFFIEIYNVFAHINLNCPLLSSCECTSFFFFLSNSCGINSSLFRPTDIEIIFIFLLGGRGVSYYIDPMRTKLQMICSLSAIHYKCFCKFTQLGYSLFTQT